MASSDELRRRLAAAGAELPEPFVDLVVRGAGDLVTALDDLAGLDLGDAEPFVPSDLLTLDAKA